jgi:AbrB family looped-hinge helix DNA binding protein
LIVRRNFMAVARVSAKGQITLPAESRRAVGIKPLDRVLIEVRDAEIVVKPVGDFFKLKGFLGRALPRREEKKHAALAAAARSVGKK